MKLQVLLPALLLAGFGGIVACAQPEADSNEETTPAAGEATSQEVTLNVTGMT